MQSSLLKFLEMAPLGVSRPLSENDSASSLVLDSSVESGNESTMLSSACSQNINSEQVVCQNSTEEQSSQVSSNDTTDSLNKYKRFLSLSQLKEYKRYISVPITQIPPSLNNESNNHGYLSSCNERTSTLQERTQQLANYLDSQIAEMRSRSDGNEFMSSTASYELSTEGEIVTDCISGGSKVVVQVMPQVSFGNITALQQCMDDIKISRTPKNNLEPAISKTGSNKRCFESTDRSTISRTKILKLPDNQTSDDDDFVPSCYPMKKKRRNHAFNFHIRKGRGKKLSEIDYIASAIPNASSNVLQLIHYVFFGTYGSIHTESKLEKVKTDILHFSGFCFNELSEIYEAKFKALMRIPFPPLLAMHEMLVGKPSVDRSVMVRQLLNFCLKPSSRKLPAFERPSEIYNDMIIGELKQRILEGPSPVVKLERLSEEYIKKMIHIKEEVSSSETCDQDHSKTYVKPGYIVNGPGIKLKSFPHVVSRVYKARRRIINLLHIFLFGKPGSDEINRLNILEFNGFLQYDNSFFERKIAVLKKYKKEELEQMCNIFSLRSKSGNKSKKIKKLLFYLQTPSLVLNYRRKATASPLQPAKQTTQKLMMPANAILSNLPNPNIPKLRDFETICFNIECAPPKDLAELNDLLFVKPCDITEIHEKLLNFTPFLFDEYSFEFQYRKTLMHYMGFPIIKKIANILDIALWEQYECEQELAMTILKFLMTLKQPAKARKKVPCSAKTKMKNEVLTSRYRPQILTVRKDPNFSSDQKVCSTSLPPGLNNPASTSNSSHEFEDPEVGPNSTVVIQRISESSYSWTDLQNDGPVTISNANSDESIPLLEFAHHPTENQLELTVKTVICSNSMSTSLGDLLNKVFQHYPKFNLTYRTDFIKSKALEILHEIQECMVDSTLDATYENLM